MVPLLQLISRGSPMSYEDSNRIIPLFYLFSSLFSHSLISVHDSEFFGHEMEGTRLLFFPNVPCMCPQLDLLLSKTFFWVIAGHHIMSDRSGLSCGYTHPSSPISLIWWSQQNNVLSVVFSSRTPSCRHGNVKINICERK